MFTRKAWFVLALAWVAWSIGGAAPAAAATMYFSDAGGPLTWDQGVTANWSNVSGGPYNVVWGQWDDAVLEGTGGQVNVSGTVDANSLTFDADGYLLTGGTVRIGDPATPGIFVKDGYTATVSSTLGSDTQNNPVHIGTAGYAGTLAVGANSAAWTRTLSVDAGTLRLVSSNTTWNCTITGSGLVQLQFSPIGASNTRLNNITGFTGTVELTTTGATGDKWNVNGLSAGGATVQIDSGTQLYVNSSASTFAGVRVAGTGNTESRGAIRLSNTLNAPVTLLGNATIGTEGGNITGPITSGAAGTQILTIGATNDITGNATLSGSIGGGTGDIALNMVTRGDVTLSGAGNSYGGGTTLSAGRLVTNVAGGLGTGPVRVAAGAEAFLRSTTFNNQFFISGDGGSLSNNDAQPRGALRIEGATIGASGSVTLEANASLGSYSGNTGTVNAAIGESGGSWGLGINKSTSATPGTIVLGGANTYSGGTTVYAGTLSVSNDNNLGATGAANYVTLNGGRLTTTANITLNANHKLVIGAGGGTVNGTSNTGLVNNGADMLRGSGTLTITGSSSTDTVLQFSGAQSGFSGAININSGRINLNNAAATLGTGDITVGTGSASLYLSAAVTLANRIRIQSNGGENRGAVRFQGGGTVNGDIVLLANAGLSSESAATPVTLNGNISGAYTLQLGGLTGSNASAVYILTGNNSYGATTLGNGTLRVGNGGATGTLGTGNVTDNGALVFNRSDSFAVGNAIGGTGSLTKLGSGTLTLTGNNTYAGTTTISGGALQVGDGGTSGTLGSGTITNNASLVFNRSDDLAVNNRITGSGGLTKTGSGTLGLATASDYAGDTLISQGTIAVAGISGFQFYRFTINQTRTPATDPKPQMSEVDFGLDGTWYDAATCNGPGGTFSGSETPSKLIDNDLNTKCYYQNPALPAYPLVFAFGSPVPANQYRWATANDVDARDPAAWTMEGSNSADPVTGVGSWTLLDTQTGFVSTTSRKTWNSTFSIAVPVFPPQDNILSPYSTFQLFGAGGAATALDLASTQQTIGALAGDGNATVALGTGTLTTGGNNADTTFAGTLTGEGGSLVKAGTGTMILTGASTYSGGTTVTEGTLLVNNTAGSATGSGPVQVNRGTLGGNGTMSGPVTVGDVPVGPTAIDSYLAPGNSPGILSTGSLTMNSDAMLLAELWGPIAGDPINGYDQVDVTGGVTLNGPSLDLDLQFAPALGDRFVLIQNDGADAVVGTFATPAGSLAEGSIVRDVFNGYSYPFSLSYMGGTGNDVVLTAVPEPSALLLVLLGLVPLIVGLARRRRRPA